MKKFLAILLIAIVACSTVEELDTFSLDDVALLGFDPKKFIELWKKVKGYVLRAVKFLKDNGFYDPLVAFLKKNLRSAALNFCEKKGIDLEFCQDIINFIVKQEKK